MARASTVSVEELRAQFHSRDRRYPVFLPGFHAPDVVMSGGWDVVIMNPPYVGRKEVPGRIGMMRVGDLERHYGRTYDLMIHFAFRALQLVRTGGVVSMIFNDSIFTSADADEFRRTLLADAEGQVTLHVATRTRCFEGVAVNGGVVVATRSLRPDPEVRWVENHGRPPTDLLGATITFPGIATVTTVGQSELFETEARQFHRLPHRPLFRPSDAALRALDVFKRCAGWDQFSCYVSQNRGASWSLLSNTRALNDWKREALRTGFYDRLRPGEDFVLLGLVTEGGQGLATADDRRFIAAVDGTREAVAAHSRRGRLEAITLAHPEAARVYQTALAETTSVEAALLEVADRFHPQRELRWPREGEVRIAPPQAIRQTRLTPDEVESGISSGPSWVPFEKGDSSGPAGASAWRRDNPLVIDWSSSAVRLLRSRARAHESYRKPRLQNEQNWGKAGVTWNSIASYLRARLTPDGGIFGHMAPTIMPSVEWLPTHALLALLNAPVLDFILRALLGSRMHIEIGDIRRLPVPVLEPEDSAKLETLGRRAVLAKEALDTGDPGESLKDIEGEVDNYVRALYGFSADADLWVVR